MFKILKRFKNSDQQQPQIEEIELQDMVKSSATIDLQPPETILNVFSFLDAKSLNRASKVSYLWHGLALDESLWRHRVASDFTDSEKQRLPNESSIDLYKRLVQEKKDALYFIIKSPKELTKDGHSLDTESMRIISRMNFNIFSTGDERLISHKTLNEALKKRDHYLAQPNYDPAFDFIIMKFCLPPREKELFFKNSAKYTEGLKFIREVITCSPEGQTSSLYINFKDSKPYILNTQEPNPSHRASA